jgi:hypothetical protein
LKKITFAALLLAGLCVVGSPRAVAQDTSSQSSAADGTAEAITNQQLTLLRRDIRSIKKQLIAANLTLRAEAHLKTVRGLVPMVCHLCQASVTILSILSITLFLFSRFGLASRLHSRMAFMGGSSLA